jgi:hypothetical protein
LSFRTTRRLLVLVIVLGAVVWGLHYTVPSADQRRTAAAGLLPLFRHEIHRLEISRDGKRMVLEHEPEGWMVIYPFRLRADGGIVRRLLALLESLPRYDTITAEQMRSRELTLSDYGLKPPAGFLRVIAADLDFVLWLGNVSPFGEQLFVRCNHERDVTATDAALLEIMPVDLDGVRSRHVFSGSPHEWTRIELRRINMPFLQLVREAERWRLFQPIQADGDRRRIAQLLENLHRLEVTEYEFDEASAEDGATASARLPLLNLESYGLTQDTAELQVRIWADGADRPQELLAGRRSPLMTNQVYAAMAEDGAVFLMPAVTLDMLTLRAGDLRERNLFNLARTSVSNIVIQSAGVKSGFTRDSDGRWIMTEPRHSVADMEAVRGLLDGVLQLEAQTFYEAEEFEQIKSAMDPPWLDVFIGSGRADSVRTAEPEREGQPAIPGGVHLLLGRPDTNGMAQVLLPLRAVAAQVRAPALPAFNGNPADPLAYLDRTMLSLNPQHIVRINLVRNGRELTMVRNESGAWTVPAGTPPDIDQLDELLFLAAHLRAREVVAVKPADLAEYGLGPDALHITFGLVGEQGIQKIIYIGKAAPDGSVYYARLQGQDTVFTLEAAVVSAIAGELLAK